MIIEKYKEYRITDLHVGMREEFKYPITVDKLDAFLALIGDINPLHTDDAFAKAHGFKGRVAYGMLTASLISTLGGVLLPGKYCLIQGVEVKFSKPVFIGDELTVIGEVGAVDIDLRYVEIKVTILNQDNKKVLRGLLKAGVLDEG